MKLSYRVPWVARALRQRRLSWLMFVAFRAAEVPAGLEKCCRFSLLNRVAPGTDCDDPAAVLLATAQSGLGVNLGAGSGCHSLSRRQYGTALLI